MFARFVPLRRALPLVAGSLTLGIAAYHYTNNTNYTFTLPSFPFPRKVHSDSRNFKKYSVTRLHAECMRGNLKAIREQIEDNPKFDVNDLHPQGGWSLLHNACLNGHADIAKFLLDHGADPNIREKAMADANSSTRKIMEYVEMRREYYFNRKLADHAQTDGFTPLHCAVISDNPEVVRLLVEHGADPKIANSQGHLAIDYFDPTQQSDEIGEILKHAEINQQTLKKQKEKELRKQHPLEEHLRKAIVGQDSPINAVGSAIRRKQNGWHDEGRPLVFLFLGSSGIGKTELAKQLSTYLHGEPLVEKSSFIRIDMSEFQTKHEVAKFIGSPPGYVGHEEGGQLTKRLKDNPNAIVLLDEVEKAHIDVLTVLLQVFDEGRLTDGKGDTVDCKDAIFVMTSNLAQIEIAEEALILREAKNVPDEKEIAKKFMDDTIYPILRRHFRRDEFLGRINEVLFFLPFTQIELEQIVEKELQRWQEKALTKHEIHLKWDDKVIQSLTHGYNVHYGARSIKHEVEKRVVNQIAKEHESDLVGPGSVIKLYVDETGTIKLKTTKGEPLKQDASILSKLWK